jgi:formylglycine-generating enzyme required for sulfatase activity
LDYLLLFIISRASIRGDPRRGYNLSRFFGLLAFLHILIFSLVVEILDRARPTYTYLSPSAEMEAVKFFWMGAAAIIGLLIFYRRSMIGGLHKMDTDLEKYVLRLVGISLFTFILSESITVLGLILYFKTGNPLDYYPLAIISLFLVIIYLPKYTEWEGWIEQRDEKGEADPRNTGPAEGMTAVRKWGIKKTAVVIAGLILVPLLAWRLPDLIRHGEPVSGTPEGDRSMETAVSNKTVVAPKRRKEVLGIEFFRIPGGEFLMGLDIGEVMERPVHHVIVGEFYLGRYEVTQEQWRGVMGDNPSEFEGCDDCPVENVSWNDVQEFLGKAGEMSGVELRLPTEAEWEYAAGGGSLHQMWAGTDSEDSLNDHAWSKVNSGYRTHPVGKKAPNRFGLHDMSGNVREWCSDWYDREYYLTSPEDNPRGPASGKLRVMRGGSWAEDPEYSRVTYRTGEDPAVGLSYHGFRVALDAP